MTTKTRKPSFTPEQRDAYRKEQRDRSAELMKTAVGELLTSEGWTAWAKCRARMHRYSFANTMLILAQMPDATHVASMKFWNDHERKVIKGERSLKVNAPLFRNPTAEEIAAGHPADKKVLAFFKLVPVFDVSQTDGEPLPVIQPEPVTGDSHAEYLRPLEKMAHSLGYSVSHEDLSDGMGGYCDYAAKHIAIAKGDAVNSQVRTLVHEIAHALGLDYKEYTRSIAEVLVDTATFIVCTSIGLDTSGSTVPYVAGWGGDGAVAAIEKFAVTVDEVARKIEKAVTDAEVA